MIKESVYSLQYHIGLWVRMLANSENRRRHWFSLQRCTSVLLVLFLELSSKCFVSTYWVVCARKEWFIRSFIRFIRSGIRSLWQVGARRYHNRSAQMKNNKFFDVSILLQSKLCEFLTNMRHASPTLSTWYDTARNITFKSGMPTTSHFLLVVKMYGMWMIVYLQAQYGKDVGIAQK